MDSILKVLMVAEKPSVAKAIAEALAEKKEIQTIKAKLETCPIFSWRMQFQNQNVEMNCTSVTGHIFSRDFHPDYQDWKRDPIELFDAPTIKKENNLCYKKQIVEHLQTISKDCSFLILWLDNDREGENICFEVIDIVQQNLLKSQKQQIFRAKFSSLTKEDLVAAFQSLNEQPNKNLSLSVEARQILDLKVGIAFSRMLTKYLMRKYEDLQSNVVSFGPCQTPTLGFCVNQSEKIEMHQIQKQFIVQPLLTNINTNIQKIAQNQQNALQIKKQLEDKKKIKVVKVEIKKEFLKKPAGLNTITLLKLASKFLHISPAETMRLAQQLYLYKLITYPRTESTNYTATFDFISPIKAIEKTNKMAQQLLQNGINPIVSGQFAGDHPPITLTSRPVAQKLGEQESQLYDLICRYYMATLSTDAEYEKQYVTLDGGEQLLVEGSLKKVEGFLYFLPELGRVEITLPASLLQNGQEIKIQEVKIFEECQKGPQPVTEYELIEMMDQHHIGTDASMASHIQNIQQKQYVTIDEVKRELHPTKLGMALIKGLKLVDKELASPEIRASIEHQINQIAIGKANYDFVLKQSIELFKKKYQSFYQNIGKLDAAFENVFTSTDQAIRKILFIKMCQDTAPLFSLCGRCKQQMRLLNGKIFCQKCNCMIGLPKKIVFERSNEFCEKDGYEYLKEKGGKQKICPLCSQKAFREQQGQKK